MKESFAARRVPRKVGNDEDDDEHAAGTNDEPTCKSRPALRPNLASDLAVSDPNTD